MAAWAKAGPWTGHDTHTAFDACPHHRYPRDTIVAAVARLGLTQTAYTLNPITNMSAALSRSWRPQCVIIRASRSGRLLRRRAAIQRPALPSQPHTVRLGSWRLSRAPSPSSLDFHHPSLLRCPLVVRLPSTVGTCIRHSATPRACFSSVSTITILLLPYANPLLNPFALPPNSNARFNHVQAGCPMHLCF